MLIRDELFLVGVNLFAYMRWSAISVCVFRRVNNCVNIFHRLRCLQSRSYRVNNHILSQSGSEKKTENTQNRDKKKFQFCHFALERETRLEQLNSRSPLRISECRASIQENHLRAIKVVDKCKFEFSVNSNSR